MSGTTLQSQSARELALAKKALDRGLITISQLKAAFTERARDIRQKRPEARSLGAILIARGDIGERQWAGLLEESQTRGRFGKYVLGRELGRGGMGIVYEALDTEHRRRVAVKLLNADLEKMDGQEKSEERFLQEARLLAILPPHPSVVGVYEAGLIDGQRYLAMELVDGQPMCDWLKTAPLQQALAVLRQVALAVHHTHGHGIIHRDLKPDNILIRRDGTPVVMDFGLAIPEQRSLRLELTAQGYTIGSPGYMSPEQARGRKGVDRTTDVYSLGIMLFEIVTGRRPFEGVSPVEVLAKTVQNQIPRPSSVMRSGLNPVLLQKLDALCLRALSAHPKDRYPTAKAFAEELALCFTSSAHVRAG